MASTDTIPALPLLTPNYDLVTFYVGDGVWYTGVVVTAGSSLCSVEADSRTWLLNARMFATGVARQVWPFNRTPDYYFGPAPTDK
jgi:hypothetical protein